MIVRSSDRTLPTAGLAHRVRGPDDVTVVGRRQRVSSPTLPHRRPRHATPRAMPSIHDLAMLARNLGASGSLQGALAQLQRDLERLFELAEVACLWLDWPNGAVLWLGGQLGEPLQTLVSNVAGSGRRVLVGSMLLEPVGPPPARVVLALRKPSGRAFTATERTVIATLAAGIAPALDRLIATQRL